MGSSEFFDRLFLLPLFQGMGRDEFLEIAGQIRIGFHTLSGGDVFAAQDTTCNALYFVLNGNVKISRSDSSLNLKLTEWGNAPMVVQPSCLFGLTTRFFRTFEAYGETQILRIDKQAVRKLLSEYTTFRINYLNLLSAHTQRLLSFEWRTEPRDLVARFVGFIEGKCLRPIGRKELRIKMEDLAQAILASRLRVSQMLASLKSQGLIELSRECIVIPSFEKLKKSYC